MAQPTIQRGTKDLGDTLTSMTIVRGVDSGFDTTVDPTKTILIVRWRTAGVDAEIQQSYNLRRVLTDGDTITIDRGLATSDGVAVTVEWALYSFASGVTVQHKSFSASASVSGTIAVTSVDTATTFLIDSGNATSAGTGERSWLEWNLASTTSLAWARGVASGNVAGACQVVTYDDCTVQTVSVNLDSTANLDNDVTVTSVDAAATAIFGSMKLTSGSSSEQELSARLTSATNLRLTRSITTAPTTLRATVYLVTFTDGTTVQHFSPAHGSGTATVNTTVTSVDAAVTMVSMACIANGLPAGRGGSAAYGRVMATAELTTTTNLQTVKGIATTAITYDIDIITFATGAPAEDTLVQPVGLTDVSGNPATSSGSLTSTLAGLTRLTAAVGGVQLDTVVVITKR